MVGGNRIAEISARAPLKFRRLDSFRGSSRKRRLLDISRSESTDKLALGLGIASKADWLMKSPFWYRRDRVGSAAASSRAQVHPASADILQIYGLACGIVSDRLAGEIDIDASASNAIPVEDLPDMPRAPRDGCALRKFRFPTKPAPRPRRCRRRFFKRGLIGPELPTHVAQRYQRPRNRFSRNVALPAVL